MAATYPGGVNTYIPSHEASQNMVVDFSRNIDKFALPRYCQYVPVTHQLGYYLKMTVEEAGRVLDADGANFEWPDGARAPKGNDATESFQFSPFMTRRRAHAFNIGYLAAEQAGWDILAQHARIYAQQAMTVRTSRAVSALTTAANYDSDHTSDVADITGNTGKLDASTSTRMDIKRSLDYAADTIRRETLGAVGPGDLMLVVSPGFARKISITQEIVNLIAQSPAAKEYIHNKLGPQAQYGLPADLYGYPIVVEDAVKVTSRKGAAKTTSYVMPDASPVMVSRVGGLEGAYGSPSFSSLTMFIKEDMTVESLDNPNDRLHQGRVVDDCVPILTAPAASFLFTNAVS